MVEVAVRERRNAYRLTTSGWMLFTRSCAQRTLVADGDGRVSGGVLVDGSSQELVRTDGGWSAAVAVPPGSGESHTSFVSGAIGRILALWVASSSCGCPMQNSTAKPRASSDM